MTTLEGQQDEAPRIERVFLPSRIRRGRAATTPVWYVIFNGDRKLFFRKKDAVAAAVAALGPVPREGK